MRSICISYLVLLCCTSVLGQEPIHSREVRTEPQKELTGPNTDYYQHGVFSFGYSIPMDESDSLQTRVGGSFMLEYGTRGKVKVNEWFAGVWDLSYHRMRYEIQQDSMMNLLGLGTEYEKQFLVRHSLQAGIGFRINFGKRGNTLGKYLDLAGYGSWAFGNRMRIITEDEPTQGNFGSREQDLQFERLTFLDPLEYGVNTRVGLNKVIFWGRYRLSDIFRADAAFNNGRQLPNIMPLAVGIQFAL